jgi:hypothetical protein
LLADRGRARRHAEAGGDKIKLLCKRRSRAITAANTCKRKTTNENPAGVHALRRVVRLYQPGAESQ